MSLHTLGVFDTASRVGNLEYESLEERFSFSYEPTWRAAENAYPISPHIPLSGEHAASSTVRRFLENLLPEGRALDIVSTTHQVSRNNIYGLVRELGRETTGALSFLPEGAEPRSAETTRREVTREELKERIDTRAQIPFSVWDGRVRMSIAGHQDKLPVYLQNERMYLVEGALASTHILKPEPARRPVADARGQRALLHALGPAAGAPVAPVSILRFPDPVLVVERFDRVREPGRVRRVHIDRYLPGARPAGVLQVRAQLRLRERRAPHPRRGELRAACFRSPTTRPERR